MRKVYISFDDEWFDNEEDCLNHEREQFEQAETIFSIMEFFTDKREKITEFEGEDAIDRIENAMDTARFLRLNRDFTDEEFSWWIDFIGYAVPTKKGLYRYDDRDEWVSVKRS